MYSNYSSRRSMVTSPYLGPSGLTGLTSSSPVTSNGYNRYRDYSNSRFSEVTSYSTPVNYSSRCLRRGNSLEPTPSPPTPPPSYSSASLSRTSSSSRSSSSSSRKPSDLLSDYINASARAATSGNYDQRGDPHSDRNEGSPGGRGLKRQPSVDSRMDPRDHTRYLTPREKLDSFRAQPYREKRPISCDKVHPGILIGNGETILDISHLKHLGVTHVLNTAEHHVEVSPGAYSLNNIQYYGFHVDDLPQANISRFFRRTTDFIHRAVESGGVVVVNCYMGLSRSATCVIAYLMMKQNMTCRKALEIISQSRRVRPNPGFLQQLSELEHTLRLSGRFTTR